MEVDLARAAARGGPSRRRDRRRSWGQGRYVRSAEVEAGRRISDVAVDATRRARARRVMHSGQERGLMAADLRVKIRERARQALVVFLVDASDSMGVRRSMAAAKGAVLALLTTAYEKRERIALVSFRDQGARMLLPPTTSVSLARERLHRLRIGGTTPLAAGLAKVWQLVKNERLRDPELEPRLVLISDGEANVPLEPSADPEQELHTLAGAMRRDRIHTVVIDTAPLIGRGQAMRQLAAALGGPCWHINALRAPSVVAVAQAAREV